MHDLTLIICGFIMAFCVFGIIKAILDQNKMNRKHDKVVDQLWSDNEKKE